jgi:hypothetical protein
MGRRSGQDDMGRRKILPLPELELRPQGLPARNQSLSGLFLINITSKKNVI